jgi:hypothetical protein
MPEDAHLLLREGWAALRRSRLQGAVIDAGAAVELTLADFNRTVTKVNPPKAPTLGWYISQPALVAGASLPSNIKADLVDVRNAAIHRNSTPSHAKARVALEMAKGLVKRLKPLPI